MPIYEYVCPGCEFKFEKLRLLSQVNEDAPCPQCQQSAERVLSVFACFSRDERGVAVPVGGGSSCSSCSATSCDTCGL